MKRYQLLIGIIAFFLCLAFFALTSCNLTRTVTTSAQHYQSGDTTTTIITKTIETYDGAIKRDNFLK